MGKLVVFTGLDGSGTSSVAEYLHQHDPGSKLFKSPPVLFDDVRELMDTEVRAACPEAHYLFYLATNVYLSKQIEEAIKEGCNVYCVRYFIDTIVSQRAAGLAVDLVYNTDLYEIIKPDLTIFLDVNEDLRQQRLENRGKGFLDKELDNVTLRTKFLNEFSRLERELFRIDVQNHTVEEVAVEVRKAMNNLD